MEQNTASSWRYSSDPNVPRAKVREPVRFACIQYDKSWKGTARYLSVLQSGQVLNVYDNGKHMQLSSANGCWVWTPWDEATVPIGS
jgi:hypothetical protein